MADVCFALEDYEATVERCMNMIRRDAQALLSCPGTERWVVVGGTMTTLGAMQRGVPTAFAWVCQWRCDAIFGV